MAAPTTPAVETTATTLDAGLLKLAHDIEHAMSGSPEFIGPGGLRFNAAERLRHLLAESRARPEYGIRWISGEPKLFTHLDQAVDQLHSDNRYFRNSRLFERTITEWRPRPETGAPGWARANPPTPF
ncbi:MAG TPA: hypothetical protein VF885_05870 [Arthrobacter sp.]